MFCTKQYVEQWKPQSRSIRRNDIFGGVIGLYKIVFTTHSFRHDPTQHSFRLGAGWHSKKNQHDNLQYTQMCIWHCNFASFSFHFGWCIVFYSFSLIYSLDLLLFWIHADTFSTANKNIYRSNYLQHMSDYPYIIQMNLFTQFISQLSDYYVLLRI